MSSTVVYKGETLTTVDNETKTLETAGTWLEDDIEITDVSSGGGGVTIVDTQDSHGGTIREITTTGTAMAMGTITPQARTITVTFDTGLTTIHGILIVPTSTTPLISGGRTLISTIITPNDYYQSIFVCSNQAGSAFLTPSGSTTSPRMTQSGTSVTVTSTAAVGYFEAVPYTWYAW